jgi:hypothetical protein
VQQVAVAVDDGVDALVPQPGHPAAGQGHIGIPVISVPLFDATLGLIEL